MSCSICYTEPNKTIICCSCYIETCQDCFISNIKSKIGISDMKQAFSGDNVKCLGVNCHESFQLPTLFKIMVQKCIVSYTITQILAPTRHVLRRSFGSLVCKLLRFGTRR